MGAALLAADDDAHLDAPTPVEPHPTRGDRVFHGTVRGIGLLVLALMGSIGVFLGSRAVPTLSHYGLRFFTEAQWNPESDKVGIAAVLVGTIEVGVLALALALPLALLCALFITEYAPRRLRRALVSTLDLMAAIPSIIWGIWGFFLIQPHALFVAHWISRYLGWIPLLHVADDPSAAAWAQTRYTSSVFIASIAVACMIVPMACSVMCEVFSQAPNGEREAAIGLGATKLGVIRGVVLPFGKGGIIGGSMIALGRALGETISVLLILNLVYEVHLRPLQSGGSTISALIATRVPESTPTQLAALLTAGFVLFLITLVVNSVAATLIGRARSGAVTEL